MTPTLSYRGRFAPSPTGPLHFGSLVAALGSCLDARANRGEWLVRMEDVDSPRCVAGADRQILKTLEASGFEWDGEVVYQSRRSDLYRAAFDRLNSSGCLFPCACTRKQLAGGAPAIDGGQLYDGRCRNGLPPGARPRAWRLRVPDAGETSFDDAIQGRMSQQLRRDVGDFVVLRADGLFAYQLAVIADDDEQGITHVVRGADLLDSTPRQIFLQQLLGYPQPVYAHLPVAVDANGEKLSKQTLAAPVDVAQPLPALLAAWRFLGQMPEAPPARVNEFWEYAITHWRLSKVPQRRAQAAPDYSPLYSR
ncbi:Glutamyl-Q tRNA(Asp) synthetase [Georgfuchsia toluolica]|uniref:Glutamyl-Q tRNA(Asp) synthetase n=1 Tax=Georgfuchsia toluolica TaxID=424218 RepID=A0A916J5Y3_9PROT|nr:tRNA glutamyl-Q(34) synthetase GluQRS [Georgfuchsia toluolica]CAG4884552.1 Glutamyl-Q tRNA(Asp) synthetase [Georgfuchsia toluolica]